MNWHANCTHTCTCTTSHHQPNSEFARSAPRAAAKAADTRSLPVSAAPIIHDQMYDGRRAGARSWGCGRHAPVRVFFVRGRDRTSLLKLGAGFGPRPFTGSRGGSNRTLASINNTLRDCRLKCFAKGSEHSKTPSRYGPEPSEAGGRKIGNVIQGQN